jgi:hypothetical protein
VLSYKQLVGAMTKCHKTVEVIRGVPTGRPKFANATLGTTDPSTLAGATFDFRVSDYFKQLVRLQVTQA